MSLGVRSRENQELVMVCLLFDVFGDFMWIATECVEGIDAAFGIFSGISKFDEFDCPHRITSAA